LRYRFQLRRILISERQFNRPPPRCHDLTPSLGTRDLHRNPRIEMNRSSSFLQFYRFERIINTPRHPE
jgi:hypothetical protein